MVPRENKNNPHAKFGGTNKEYYGIFRSGILSSYERPSSVQTLAGGGHSHIKIRLN